MLNRNQLKWICSVLANDEASTDAELRAYFVEHGLHPDLADLALQYRSTYLRGCVLPGVAPWEAAR